MLLNQKTSTFFTDKNSDIVWEGLVIADHHTLQKAKVRVSHNTDNVMALEWDEACCAFSLALIDACASPRLLDLKRKLFSQSRRFCLALLCEENLLLWFAQGYSKTDCLCNFSTR